MWGTVSSGTSLVVYGTGEESYRFDWEALHFGYPRGVPNPEAPSKTTEHVVTLIGLVPDTTYVFRVISHLPPAIISEEHKFTTLGVVVEDEVEATLIEEPEESAVLSVEEEPEEVVVLSPVVIESVSKNVGIAEEQSVIFPQIVADEEESISREDIFNRIALEDIEELGSRQAFGGFVAAVGEGLVNNLALLLLIFILLVILYVLAKRRKKVDDDTPEQPPPQPPQFQADNF